MLGNCCVLDVSVLYDILMKTSVSSSIFLLISLFKPIIQSYEVFLLSVIDFKMSPAPTLWFCHIFTSKCLVETKQEERKLYAAGHGRFATRAPHAPRRNFEEISKNGWYARDGSIQRSKTLLDPINSSRS